MFRRRTRRCGGCIIYERHIDEKVVDLISKLRVTDTSDESLTELIKRLKSSQQHDLCDFIAMEDALYAVKSIARTKNVKFMEKLIDAENDIKSVNVKAVAFNTAVEERIVPCLKLLLQKGASVSKNILLRLKWKGFEECLKLLIHAGADINAVDIDNNTPLICAAHDTCNKCVDLLIQAGADVNHCNNVGITALTAVNTDLHESISKCGTKNIVEREECIKLLLEAGADVELSGGDALIDAIIASQVNCVRILIEAGADVNVVNKHGFNPLIIATRFSRGECMKLLIEAGVDVNKTNKRNNTALLATAGSTDSRKSFKHAVLLLQTGAHVNKVNDQGHNALKSHIIAQTRDKDVTMLLFAAGEIIDGITVEKEDYKGRIENIPVPDHLLELMKPQLDLKHTCRETIRKHLMKLDAHLNLFHRIPQLGLPSSINSYLLYDMSLDKM